MAATRRLSWSDSGNITNGQQLTYIDGSGDSFLEANVTVYEVGRTGCAVQIDEVLTQGKKSHLSVGERIFARWQELEIFIP
jgi:hypothetical protein